MPSNDDDGTLDFPYTDTKGVLYSSINIRIKAPDGNFYFIFDEDRATHKLVRIGAIGGKTGSIQAAWLDAFCRVISRQIERGLLTIEELKVELSSTTSDKSRTDGDGIVVTSGPEALFIALCRYTDAKYEELEENIGLRKHMSEGPRKG